MEKIISRVRPKEPEVELRELKEFVERFKGKPFGEAEQEIAERRFRKPVILFRRLAIRPVWRNGREAPPFFPRKTIKIADPDYRFIAHGH